jgi:ribosomal protein S12 methylthiotransferase
MVILPHLFDNLILVKRPKPKQTTVGFVSLGCPKNTVDSERMLAEIIRAGYLISSDPALCDVVVINTCGFIEPAKLEAFEAVRQALVWKKTGRVKKLIVAGCLAQRMGAELLTEFPGIDALVGLGQRDDVTVAIAQALKSRKSKTYLRHSDNYIPNDKVRLRTGPAHWAYLRISEGCDHACSFCTIPSIRGRFRSKPIQHVLDEARELIDSGTVELNIIGQDTTSYGRDLKIKHDSTELAEHGLAQLLTHLQPLSHLAWIRLLYMYPAGITDQLIDTIAAADKVVHYFDIPIQHINDRILKDMHRPDTKKKICSVLSKLREKFPDCILRTTLIVGFPGETDVRFGELLDFVRDVRFDALGCFKYYAESGTPAAALPHQVPEKVKDQRVSDLMLAQQKIAFEKNAQRVGTELTCLVDSLEADGSARARFYGQAPEIDSICIFERCSGRPGSFLNAKVTGTKNYDLLVEQI